MPKVIRYPSPRRQWRIGWSTPTPARVVKLARRGPWLVELVIEPRDLWIGLYWTWKRFPGARGQRRRRVDLYAAALPCVVLHVEHVADE